MATFYIKFNRVDTDADTGNGCCTHLLVFMLMLKLTVNGPIEIHCTQS